MSGYVGAFLLGWLANTILLVVVVAVLGGFRRRG